MKKVFFAEVLAVLLLAGVMAVLLYRKTPADVPLDDVNRRLQENCSLSGMEEAGDLRMKRAFLLNAADYEEYLYYAPDNTMSVNEILIVKCADESAFPGISEAFSERLAVQKKNFDGYGTDQTALLNQAKTGFDAPYAWFLVGADADEWLDTAKSVWEVDK